MTFKALSLLGGATLIFAVSTAQALPARSFERAELFATCSGRLAALATRQRAHREAEADTNARISAQFDQLLEAVLPSALQDGVPPGQARQWRYRGWNEIAALLADADYSFDQRRADAAWRAMTHRIRSCREVLL